MIRIFALSTDYKIINISAMSQLTERKTDLSWYWVDFDSPNEEENKLLDSFFHFHHLAVEDCLNSIDKPKLDYYDNYNFIILNALDQATLEPKEIALFEGDHFIVTHHKQHSNEVQITWDRITSEDKEWEKGPIFVTHKLMDKIVDQFFPAVNEIEDYLSDLDNTVQNKSIHILINEVFEIRGKLLRLRRLVISMRDLVYRILNSEHLNNHHINHKIYFSDIYDHLLKIVEMIESSREMTADLRDSFLSVNTNRMNNNMMLLTVITTIFIPLTFIAGIYGMNFSNMPELQWKYGYYIILLVMLVIGILMYFWFKRKGWFDS
ncbi:magnesium and cobalt transport protein CorA [Syntrophobotulus glycolicus DSM 8271]|uniref:Magnesium transport protein CorA n=1 Tax=Syntrophobotulus glycolicus (strain DSM 8271 / FlGlyR) TaxID=645991 RepID=F0SYW6_SYNGF|nr:magnesium/cobalt transporter CorA [Syntrophobotulus glycolicus]ADY56003.1 magnesium and cobalt transport protein CorA [Syntrophobotulus glycolicus DSM 8271]